MSALQVHYFHKAILLGLSHFVPDIPLFLCPRVLIYYSPLCLSIYIFNALRITSDPLPNCTVIDGLSDTILLRITYSSSSQNITPWLSASVSPRKLLEIQILRPHPRPTDSETRGDGAQCSVFQEPFQVILVVADIWEALKYLILSTVFTQEARVGTTAV